MVEENLKGNIIPRPEDIMNLQIRFLTDRRLASLRLEIAAVLQVSIPVAIMKIDDGVIITYDEKTEYEVNRIKSIIKEICDTEYSILFKNELE